VSSNKYVAITASNPNQEQVTTIDPQANAVITNKVVNHMLRSFDLVNKRRNLEEDNPFDYFLQ
jgi:hypothetical protein